MAPKIDPNEVRYLTVRCVAGEQPNSAALAPKLGPLGLSPKKVGDDIIKATKQYTRGINVTVELKVQNRQATVTLVPAASTLVIAALKEAPRDKKKEKNVKHNGNIPLSEIIKIAREMRSKSFAKELKGTVKEVLGTAQSVGAKVDGKPAKVIIDQISAGILTIPAE